MRVDGRCAHPDRDPYEWEREGRPEGGSDSRGEPSWEPQLGPVPALGEHTEAILAEFNVARAGREPERP